MFGITPSLQQFLLNGKELPPALPLSALPLPSLPMILVVASRALASQSALSSSRPPDALPLPSPSDAQSNFVDAINEQSLMVTSARFLIPKKNREVLLAKCLPEMILESFFLFLFLALFFTSSFSIDSFSF